MQMSPIFWGKRTRRTLICWATRNPKCRWCLPLCRFSINWVVFSNTVYFHPYSGKIPILTNIFQRGWNHQLLKFWQLDLAYKSCCINVLLIQKNTLEVVIVFDPPKNLRSRSYLLRFFRDIILSSQLKNCIRYNRVFPKIGVPPNHEF